jgi:hypothetical protein
MMGSEQVLGIHQRLGRLGYFHALFIEPVLTDADVQLTHSPVPCCVHAPGGARQSSAGTLVRGTAWAVVEDIATHIAPDGGCPNSCDECCATCRILNCGYTIAATWANTQDRVLHSKTCQDHAADRAIAVLLTRAFATQHQATCSVLAATVHKADLSRAPSVEDLPLTAELFDLWADPFDSARTPVQLWLNHCTDMDDIRHVLNLRRPDA